MMYIQLENYFISVIKGKKNGMWASCLRSILHGISWCFQVVVAARNWAFDQGLLSRYMPPVPVVVSIGNIVAGGTGKTPVTLTLAQEFEEFSVAILSRGYRSPAERLSMPIWLSKGEGPMYPASYSGDEPFLLSKNLPKAFIFVGKDRHKASNMAAKAGAHIILLDDAMQHRRLARDYEIVVLDACDPFGLGYFLPRGFLREGVKSLARADLIIFNHIYDEKRLAELKAAVSPFTKAPTVATRMDVSAIINLKGEVVADLENAPVGIFCGIAHPDYFQRTVSSLNCRILSSFFVPDHMDYDYEELLTFSRRCKEQGAKYLICTEKDRVKLPDSIVLDLPIVWIQMKLSIVDGKDNWHNFVDKAKSDIKKRL